MKNVGLYTHPRNRFLFSLHSLLNPAKTAAVFLYLQYNTIQPRHVQYKTTYPSKPGSAYELIYTLYIGTNAVPLLLVDFGHFFRMLGGDGVGKFYKVSDFHVQVWGQSFERLYSLSWNPLANQTTN